MKTLFLIRHAKSSWDNQLVNDHERPLNKRGIEDAPKMGDLLKASYATPEKILCSTALRAKQTASAIQAKWFPQQKVEFNVQLYEETASTILDIVHSTNQKINSIALLNDLGFKGKASSSSQFLSKSNNRYASIKLYTFAFMGQR